MPKSPYNFTTGTLKGQLPQATGDIIFVDSATGSSNGDGSSLRPFSTLESALNKSGVSSGDTIVIMEGHAETISGAAGAAIDIAGVSVIGMGVGNKRPTFSFSATTSTITMTAASCSLKNIITKATIDDVTSCIVVSAAGCTIDIEHQDTSNAVEAARVILTTAAADNLDIKLIYKGFTGGNGTIAPIQLVGVNTARIFVDFYGVASTAVVNFLTTACTNIVVKGFFYNSGTTDLSKNVVDTAGSGTWFVDGYDGAAGSLFSGGSGNAIAASDLSTIASDVATIKANTGGTDSATTVLGANDADNDYASTSVVANVDGSVLERLEALMDPLSGYNPRMGFGVTKVSNMADGAGTDNLFTVTGRVLITSLTGEVTTVIGTTTTMKLRDVTNSVDLCAATTITTDAVGTMYALTSINTNILNGTGATPVIGSIPNITGAQQTDVAIVGDVQAALTLAHVLDAAGTGAVTWRITYIPLVAGATVTAAA